MKLAFFGLLVCSACDISQIVRRKELAELDAEKSNRLQIT